MNQKIFTSKYVALLKDEVNHNRNISNYRMDKFPYDVTQEMFIPDLIKPEGLLENMLSANTTYDRAILLYNAYDKLTPLQASYAPFWEYLSHVDLYPYVKYRWPDIFSPKTTSPSRYILDHWFITRGLMRHSLSSLWWSVYMTLDNNSDDIYHFTRYIFNDREDLRLSLGQSTLFRYRPFTIAFLSFLIEHEEQFKVAYIPRCRYILHYFNRLGAIKQITTLSKEDISGELLKILPQILQVNSIDDLK